MQHVRIKQWGNSKAIRIPKNVLSELNLDTDAELVISVDKENKAIILTVDDGLTPYQKLMVKAQKAKAI